MLKLVPPGILPPFRAAPTAPSDRSPYEVSLLQFCQSFATSPERVEILNGLLAHRADLNKAGLVGWQWLSGSFVEDIENSVRARPPGDIDVVNFVMPPKGLDAGARKVFEHLLHATVRGAKTKHHCDSYVVFLDRAPEYVVKQTTYWYGLFSHSRDHGGAWKGMAAVPLANAGDGPCGTFLSGVKP